MACNSETEPPRAKRSLIWDPSSMSRCASCDELGFDDFDDEIFVMTFLVTKFRRRHPDDVSGDEISSPTLSPTLSSNSSSNSLSNSSSNSSSIKHKLTTNLMTNLTTNLMTKLTTKLMTKFRSQKRHPDAGDEISLPITS